MMSVMYGMFVLYSSVRAYTYMCIDKDHFSHTLLTLTLSLQDGYTALLLAAKYDYVDTVRELLSAGANVNHVNEVSNENST